MVWVPLVPLTPDPRDWIASDRGQEGSDDKMRMSEILSNRRHVFGAGLVAVAGVAIALAVPAMFGGGASASSDSLTVTTVVVNSPMTAYQEGVLADGHVSDTEMQETIDRVVQCVGEAGYQADRVDFNPGLGWSMDIVAETGTGGERSSAAVDECTNAQAEVMDQYWFQSRLTPAEQEKFEDLIRECLAANGVELNESQGRSLAASVPVLDGDQFAQCQIEARAQVR